MPLNLNLFFKTKYCVALTLLCLYLTGYCTLHAEDDVTTLKNLVNLIKSNESAIKSWKGKVVFNQDIELIMKAGTQVITREKAIYDISFCVDLVSGKKVVFSTQRQVKQLIGNTWIVPLSANIGALSIPEKSEFYSFRYYPPNRRGLFMKDKDSSVLQDGMGYEIASSVILNNVEPKGWDTSSSLYFNPLHYINRDHVENRHITKKLENLISFLEKRQKRNFDFDDEWSITYDNNLVSLCCSCEDGDVITHTFNLECGGMLVKYLYSNVVAQSKSPTLEFECVPQRINGIWVPKRINNTKVNFNCMVDFTESIINGPIDVSDFTLAKMGVHEGDVMQDLRTQTRTVLHGKDLLPAEVFDPNMLARGPFVFRMTLIGVGIVFILCACFLKLRRWQSSTSALKP